MLKIALSGGIGSGKSLVASVFEVLNIPCYIADEQAKRLMHESEELKGKLIQLFGEHTYDESGNLNRKYLANKVFGQPDQLQLLNQQVHPAVYQDLENWFVQQSESGYPYVLYESALIHPKDKIHRGWDYFVYVYASSEIRLERVIKRNQADRVSIRKRMEAQPNPVQSAMDADFIIMNEGQSIIQQVIALHELWKNN